ncbi:hypothetical protein [Streptomyces sp. A1277]|uniref:hypothetical protein n=1 Tax=Streptomyces sp. A1277 TaxID=2563103 RepID=UPI0019D0FA8F|nr:hypothetical protein [Streptomyces sp. A1277]
MDRPDVASVEATLNEFRLWMYVDFDDDPASRSNALDLAREIARAWRLSLGDAFPHRAFDVRASETADGPVVGFTSLPGTGG